MNKILIIYPQDATTDFLEEIPDFLFERHGESKFIYRRIGFSVSEHQECLSVITELSNDDVIVFLGHGRSDALLGAWSETFPRQQLIGLNQISILNKKKIFSLACRSTDFFSSGQINGIGFTNLITEMSEVVQERQRPNNGLAYQWIKSEDISSFRKILVSIVRHSLDDFIKNKGDMTDLCLSLKLRFNKNISNLIMNQPPESVHGVVNLLYEAKSGMLLFQ